MNVGDRVGLATLLFSEIVGNNSARHWTCRCDCGTVFLKAQRHMARGILSCGCHWRFSLGNGGTGNSRHPLYSVWARMIERCHDPKSPSFRNYGSRGIMVCDRWRYGGGNLSGFECFLTDMGPRPDGMTVERVDNNGPYSPANCIWIPRAAQARNKRNVRLYEWMGALCTIPELAAAAGIKPPTLRRRLLKGVPLHRAMIPC